MAASAHLEGFVLADQLDLVIADPPELQLRISEVDFVIAGRCLGVSNESLSRNKVNLR